MAEEEQRSIREILNSPAEKVNPGNSEILQQFVLTQARENIYNHDANVILLKMYTLFPECYHDATVWLILLKSLAALPQTDFILCKSLIPFSKHNDPTLINIFKMHFLLETCQFGPFWLFLKEHEDIFKGVKGFKDSIRKYICHVINLSYKTIQIDLLSEFLCLTAKEIDSKAVQENWEIMSSKNLIQIKSHADLASIEASATSKQSSNNITGKISMLKYISNNLSSQYYTNNNN